MGNGPKRIFLTSNEGGYHYTPLLAYLSFQAQEGFEFFHLAPEGRQSRSGLGLAHPQQLASADLCVINGGVIGDPWSDSVIA